jgi:hypothetical protein
MINKLKSFNFYFLSMPWLFGKKEEQKEEKQKGKPAEIPKSKLEIYCERHGKPELYKPLSSVLLDQPEKNISEASEASYLLPYVSVLIHQGRTVEAKKRYNSFYSKDPDTYSYLRLIIDNFDDVVKIAKDYWADLAKEKADLAKEKIERERQIEEARSKTSKRS